MDRGRNWEVRRKMRATLRVLCNQGLIAPPGQSFPSFPSHVSLFRGNLLRVNNPLRRHSDPFHFLCTKGQAS